jgi:GntP family gluconate:H+ symporter
MTPILAQAADAGGVSFWPLLVLAVSVVFIIVAITAVRVHAFLALLLAALLAGWLTVPGNLPRELSGEDLRVFEAVWNKGPCTEAVLQTELAAGGAATGGLGLRLARLINKGLVGEEPQDGGVQYRARMTLAEARKLRGGNHLVEVLEQAARDFGSAAGNIGIVIALASIIGVCLMESGAADMIVRRFMRFFGESRAGVALLASGFFLSIPVFFDTVFFLLIPLARALAVRTGKHYMLYVMAMAGGGAITHSMVPPTPGPLLVADALKLDLGVAIVAGLGAGLLPAVAVYWTARWMDRAVAVPLRDTSGASVADLHAIVNRRDEELPAFGWSVLPVALPAVLIAFASFLDMAGKKVPAVVAWSGGPEHFAWLHGVAQFFGNKTMALLIGAGLAMGIHLRQSRLTLAALGDKLVPALETAGVIILITSAGGAFGAMIRHSGVGDVIKALAVGREVNYILLAWGVTAVIRVAQGSATVAMITGSALMFAIVGDGSALPYHLVYIFLAVGFGSIILSWMNDSGFWVVGKLSGFTEKETLKSWTVMLTMISVVGLIETLVLAAVFPLKGAG